jgi:hypothetical protein
MLTHHRAIIGSSFGMHAGILTHCCTGGNSTCIHVGTVLAYRIPSTELPVLLTVFDT